MEHTLHVPLPFTEGQRRQNNDEPFTVIQTNTHVMEPTGGTNVRVFKSIITTELMHTLNETTNALIKLRPPTPAKPGRDKRGDIEKYHLGCWRKYTNQITVSKESQNKHASHWLRVNNPLFLHVSAIFQHHYPDLYAIYNAVPLPEKLVGVFGMVALNVNFPSRLHTDDEDYRNGLCWVMPFGDYDGGNLVFPDLKLEVELRPGDLVCFRSHLIEHFNRSFSGYRNSLVFFSSHTLFFPAEISPQVPKRIGRGAEITCSSFPCTQMDTIEYHENRILTLLNQNDWDIRIHILALWKLKFAAQQGYTATQFTTYVENSFEIGERTLRRILDAAAVHQILVCYITHRPDTSSTNTHCTHAPHTHHTCTTHTHSFGS